MMKMPNIGPPPPAFYHVLRVMAQNPENPNEEIPAPFEYEIICAQNLTPNVTPATLGTIWDRVRTGWGRGTFFQVPSSDNRTDLIFAARFTTWENDPWDRDTAIGMQITNPPPYSYTCGKLVFLLKAGT